MRDREDRSVEHYLYRLISRSDYARAIEALVENIDIDLLVVNQEGVVYVWNRSLEQAVCPKWEAIGRHFWEVFSGFLEEYKEQVWGERVMTEVLEKGNTIEQPRYPMKTKDGQLRIYDLKAFPLSTRDNQVSGAVLLRTDVTERILLEEQLLRNARTTSLANLGAAVAHEVRNPLNSISINIQLILEWLSAEAPIPREELIETAKVVKLEIDRLNRIIREFLHFARLAPARASAQDLATVIDTQIRVLAEEARRAGIQIVTEVDPDRPLVEFDRDQISQALYNLMQNAIQEMPDGGSLTVGLRRGKDFVQIYVRDTGPGLGSDQERQRMFDLFYTTKKEGTGLGLAIANRIVEAHRGRLVAENHSEGGAVFSIFLPLSQAAEE